MTGSIVVLGAGGFVGRRLVAALVADGQTPVVAVTRSPRAFAGAENRCLDATDTAALVHVLADSAAVVNCVAGAPETMVNGASALRSAMADRAGQPVRVVHFSSMAVYGSATGRVSEAAPLKGDVSPYAAAKVACEEILRADPNSVVLRPGCIYGPGSEQWTDRIATLLRSRRLGDLGPAGDGCSNLVFVDDVVAAVQASLRTDAAAGQAFNLSMRDAPRWNEYFVAFARQLGAVPVRRITPRKLKLERKVLGPGFKILEVVARRLKMKPPAAVMSPSMMNLWRQDIVLDVSAAEEVLGLQWTPLATGIARSVATS